MKPKGTFVSGGLYDRLEIAISSQLNSHCVSIKYLYKTRECPRGEMVDTKDLKSLPIRECRFESGRGHQKFNSTFGQVSDRIIYTRELYNSSNNFEYMLQYLKKLFYAQ